MSTIVHTVLFAMKHTKLEVMEIGLKSVWDLNDRIASQPQVCSLFYQHFYPTILRDTFQVMTDLRHLAGFKLQVKIIMQLIQLIEFNKITVPISINGQPHNLESNKAFVLQLLNSDILEAFPNLNAQQVEAYVL